ncbi:MAG: hypothetical protein Q6366_002655 [Candidatus Freyarchaeota archaeon]
MACFLIPMGLGIITTLFRKMFPKNWHIDWLNAMLWGAVAMFALEHIAHGEIVPYPPFLTAGLPEVLPEMMSIGIPMSIFSVSAWGGMVLITERLKQTNTIKTEFPGHRKFGYK